MKTHNQAYSYLSFPSRISLIPLSSKDSIPIKGLNI